MQLRIDDRTIGYDDAGSGSPVLFLHGFPHHRGIWLDQIHSLADRARVLAMDLRGFGESDPGGPYSMEGYAADVAELIVRLGVGPVVVVGLSMGGYAALAMWRHHRPLVRGLVLVSSRAAADSAAGKLRRLDLMALTRDRGADALANEMMPGMIGKSTRQKAPDIADRVYNMLISAPVGGSLGALEAMMLRPDSTDLLPTIDVPTLVVAGDEDALIPPSEAKGMQLAIPGSRLEIIEGAGHVCNIERPAAFNHLLSEYLAALTLC